MKDMNKFIKKYKGRKLGSGKYYGFSMAGMHIHAKTFEGNAGGISLYDISRHAIVEDISPENIIRISECHIYKGKWELCSYLYDSMLDGYCDAKDMPKIEKFLSPSGVEELMGIVSEMEKKYDYGKIYLQPEYYEDNNEIAYVQIIFEKCNNVQWEVLELEILALENIIKGKVAVVCIKGLVE